MSSINEHMKAWARPITDEEYAVALGIKPKPSKEPKASRRKESAESEQK